MSTDVRGDGQDRDPDDADSSRTDTEHGSSDPLTPPVDPAGPPESTTAAAVPTTEAPDREVHGDPDATASDPVAPRESVDPDGTDPAPTTTYATQSPVGSPTSTTRSSGDDPFSEVEGDEARDHTRTTAFVPTPDEDAAMRDERARRFGRPQPEGSEGTESSESDSAAGAAAGATVAGAGVSGTGATRTMPVTTTSGTTTTGTTTEGDDDPFSEFDDGPTSRAASHWWSILISIVFVPVSWYLLADGGERTSFNLQGGGEFNLAGPLELAGGLLCLFAVLLAARWSSVGVILTGTVSLLAGVAFIAFNAEAMDLVGQYQGTIVQGLDQLGQNIVDHMLRDAQSGRLAVYGFVLVMVGVVSHGARRQGRREERRRAALGA